MLSRHAVDAPPRRAGARRNAVAACAAVPLGMAPR